MAREEKRLVTGPVGSDTATFSSILVFHDRETGKFKARFSSYVTLRAAKADLAARGYHGMPFCLIRLYHHPHLVELFQNTSSAIAREIGELEDAIADVFFVAAKFGADEERKKHIDVVIEDDDGVVK